MKSANHDRWEFASTEDISRFWEKHRQVRGRDGRKKHEEERYNLGLYLLALARHELLSYPFSIEQFQEHESPDFIFTWNSGEKTGLEVTRATEPWFERALTQNDRDFKDRENAAAASGREPEPVAMLLSFGGWSGDKAEEHWCTLFKEAVAKKIAKLRVPNLFEPASSYDLLVYDETPLPAVDRQKVLAALRPYVRELQEQKPAFGKISVVVSLDVIYDLGGDCGLFPYVEWSKLKAGNRDSLLALSKSVEQAGQVAVQTAIHKHAAMGKPVYFMDGHGRMIRETPDGRRVEVRVLDDGKEIVVREL